MSDSLFFHRLAVLVNMKRTASRASLASMSSARRRAPAALLAPPQPLALPYSSPAAITYPTENGDLPLVPVGSAAAPSLVAVPSPASIALPTPPPRLPLPVAPSAAAVVPAAAREVVPALVTSNQVDDGTMWVGPRAQGKRKRAWQDVANDLVEAVAQATGRPYVEFPGEQEGPNKRRRLLLDTGNPTPTHTPVTEQVVFDSLPARRRLKAKRKAPGDLEPTVQVMVAKKQRTDEPGSTPMVIDTPEGPVQARVKRRRTKRAGPVDVEMIDVHVPLTSSGRRRRRRTTTGPRRRRTTRRRRSTRARRRRAGTLYPSALRYHPSIRQPRGWAPIGFNAYRRSSRLPVARYHPSIAASL